MLVSTSTNGRFGLLEGLAFFSLGKAGLEIIVQRKSRKWLHAKFGNIKICLFTVFWNVYNSWFCVTREVKAVGIASWDSQLHRKMFEKLRVCVSVCKCECWGIVIGITQRLNLTCLFYNFCFVKQLFTISSFYSLLSEYSQIERRFVYFFAGTLSAFPKRVTRFNTYEVEVNNLKCIRSMQHTAL